MNEPVLLKSDITSDTWLRLKAHYEARREYWRAMNDGSHDALRTERIRGRIAECKAFLALGDPHAPPEQNDA